MRDQENQTVDSSVYDKEYFEATDGADYFQANQTAPKFLKAVRLSNLREGDRVLDLGCGRGDLALALAEAGADVVGIDYAAGAVEIAKKALDQRPKQGQKNIKLLRSDATRLGFSGQTFNCVFMMDIAEHLYPDQLRRTFLECHRVLQTGGRLIVHTSPNRWYNDIGYPLWERPINKFLNKFFGQNLLTRPIRNEMDLKVHVNEHTVVSLKKYFVTAGFQPKIWLGSEYVLPVKKDSAVMQVMEVCRQVVCHAFPVSLVPPLNYMFSNNIWAIGKKRAD
ncbi:MAG: class I SAM-dependent methyltransferase [Nitrospinales bacterium]